MSVTGAIGSAKSSRYEGRGDGCDAGWMELLVLIF